MHRHAVYIQLLKRGPKPFRHASVFKTLVFRHACVSVFKKRAFSLWFKVETLTLPGSLRKGIDCEFSLTSREGRPGGFQTGGFPTRVAVFLNARFRPSKINGKGSLVYASCRGMSSANSLCFRDPWSAAAMESSPKNSSNSFAAWQSWLTIPKGPRPLPKGLLMVWAASIRHLTWKPPATSSY